MKNILVVTLVALALCSCSPTVPLNDYRQVIVDEFKTEDVVNFGGYSSRFIVRDSQDNIWLVESDVIGAKPKIVRKDLLSKGDRCK